MEKKLFVVLEGPSGAGKTTQFNLLGCVYPNAFFTREPGGTDYGEELRKLVQYRRNFDIYPMASAFTYMASRANLVGLEIRPRLERGQMVICDRYWPSTYAYQGSEGVSDNDILTLAKIATGGLEPDIYIYLDLDVDEIIRRKAECADIDRYDEILANNRGFLERVIDRYQTLIQISNNWVVINGRGNEQEVNNRIVDTINHAYRCCDFVSSYV